MEDRRDIDPAPPARGPAEAAAAPLLQQAIKVDRDLRRGLVRLPGLARMSPVSREAGSGQGSQVPHKTPQVRVPSMFPTRIPRIRRHFPAYAGTNAKVEQEPVTSLYAGDEGWAESSDKDRVFMTDPLLSGRSRVRVAVGAPRNTAAKVHLTCANAGRGGLQDVTSRPFWHAVICWR